MIHFKHIILAFLLSLSFSIQADEVKNNTMGNNNSEKCATGNCDIMKGKVIDMVKEKFNQISSSVQNQEINATAITLKMKRVLNGLSEDNNNSICMTMFTKMMKVPLETFLEYKEKK